MTRDRKYQITIVAFGLASSIANCLGHWETGAFWFGWAMGLAWGWQESRRKVGIL